MGKREATEGLTKAWESFYTRIVKGVWFSRHCIFEIGPNHLDDTILLLRLLFGAGLSETDRDQEAKNSTRKKKTWLILWPEIEI